MLSMNIVLILATVPATLAHMGFLSRANYGYSDYVYIERNAQDVVQPLREMPKSQWWFRGQQYAPPPPETFNLPAGGVATAHVACRWEYKDNTQNACVFDPGAFHSGSDADRGAILAQNKLGCALGIAYKSDPAEVQPEDMVIFSVQHDCVTRSALVPFAVPRDMPPCPNGKCVCAWFWQGQASFDEMYMNGFACNVVGSSGGRKIARPQIPVKCNDNPALCVKGAKQPLLWANSGGNIAYSENQDFPNKPQYTAKWGFNINGAQNDIFTGETIAAGDEISVAPSQPVGNPNAPVDPRVVVMTETRTITSTITVTQAWGAPTPRARKYRA